MGRWAFALLGSAILPGCMTQAMWGWDDDDDDLEPRTRTEYVGETREQAEGELELVADHLLWRSLDGGEIWARPVGDAGAAALAVLSDPEFCRVLEARIERRRVVCEMDELQASCTLDLSLGLRREAIVEVVPEAGLAPNVIRLLEDAVLTTGENSVVSWHSAFDLPFADLHWLAGQDGFCTVESQAFVAPDGALAFDGLAGPRREDLSLRERLELLRPMSLFVRMRRGADRLTVRVRPDRLWLATRLHAVDGGAGLVSALELSPLGSNPVGNADAPRIPASYVRCLTRYTRVTEQPDEDGFGTIVLKVLLTPLTLAFDVTFGALISRVLGEDDDEQVEGTSSPGPRPFFSGPPAQDWREPPRMGGSGH